MPTKVINPKKLRKILYVTPRRRNVEIDVEASERVSVYVVAADEIDNFKSGDPFDGLRFRPTSNLERDVTLPFDPGDEWYLVIENESDKPVAVHWEVYDI